MIGFLIAFIIKSSNVRVRSDKDNHSFSQLSRLPFINCLREGFLQSSNEVFNSLLRPEDFLELFLVGFSDIYKLLLSQYMKFVDPSFVFVVCMCCKCISSLVLNVTFSGLLSTDRRINEIK